MLDLKKLLAQNWKNFIFTFVDFCQVSLRLDLLSEGFLYLRRFSFGVVQSRDQSVESRSKNVSVLSENLVLGLQLRERVEFGVQAWFEVENGSAVLTFCFNLKKGSKILNKF